MRPYAHLGHGPWILLFRKVCPTPSLWNQCLFLGDDIALIHQWYSSLTLSLFHCAQNYRNKEGWSRPKKEMKHELPQKGQARLEFSIVLATTQDDQANASMKCRNWFRDGLQFKWLSKASTLTWELPLANISDLYMRVIQHWLLSSKSNWPLIMQHLANRSRKQERPFSFNPQYNRTAARFVCFLEPFEKAALPQRASLAFSLAHATSDKSSPVVRTSIMAPPVSLLNLVC